MFTGSCYIRKISKDLSKKLESLGYKDSKFVVFASPEITATYCKSGKYAVTVENPALLNAIDCGENEELFLSIAALRDDNDYMQYFKAAEVDRLLLCRDKCIEDCTTFHELYRKLTPEELIEHFNHG